MGVSLPSIPKNSRRVRTVCASLLESRHLERFGLYVSHLDGADCWHDDMISLFTGSPTPAIVTEVETATCSAFEAAIIQRWGIQAVLL